MFLLMVELQPLGGEGCVPEGDGCLGEDEMFVVVVLLDLFRARIR